MTTLSSPLDLLVYRPGTLGDHSYVIKTWSVGFREAYESALRLGVSEKHLARLMARRYFTSRSRIIQAWLGVPMTHLDVLALKDEPRVVAAFAVWTEIAADASQLHWVFTQRDWRGKGLAKYLLSRAIRPQMTYTHWVPGCTIPEHWEYESDQPPIREQP